MKNEMKNDEAVSPVIATILMVAITVVLAGVLYVWASDLASQNQSDGPSMYTLNAEDHSDPVEDDAGLMTLTFGNGNDLDWALVQIEIVKDSVPKTCDNPSASGGDCGTTQHGGQDGEHWEKGETLIISDTGADFCNADCDLTVRIKHDGDVIMSEAVHLI
ncbi:MAG: type IV pilin [Candidatus Poseidoniaceae archaeon]|nr:type IV pilin [Candidatus Poseidoniaceae archaeon]